MKLPTTHALSADRRRAELTKQLLEKGYTVRGTVRDKDAHAKVHSMWRTDHSMLHSQVPHASRAVSKVTWAESSRYAAATAVVMLYVIQRPTDASTRCRWRT